MISVNLFILTIQVVIVMVAVSKRRPKLLQSHLVFLVSSPFLSFQLFLFQCLTLVWDLALSLGFFAMAVFPTALDGKLINYKGREFNGL